MTAWVNSGLSLLIMLIMLSVSSNLVAIYAANNDEVVELINSAYIVFLLAFFFDAS